MPELIPEEILFFFQHGEKGYRTHPDFQNSPAFGIRGRIKRFCEKIEADPIIGIRLWLKYRKRLIGLPIIKNWVVYRRHESISNEELDEIIASD